MVKAFVIGISNLRKLAVCSNDRGLADPLHESERRAQLKRFEKKFTRSPRTSIRTASLQLDIPRSSCLAGVCNTWAGDVTGLPAPRECVVSPLLLLLLLALPATPSLTAMLQRYTHFYILSCLNHTDLIYATFYIYGKKVWYYCSELNHNGTD